MTKPVYKHPEFVEETSDRRIVEENKRLWLSITIDRERTDSIIVILKNPSRATKNISDKTVYNVTSYIHKNRDKYKQLKNAGKIIILNLIPFYETYSDQLAGSKLELIDKLNLETIKKFTSKHKNVITAWGDPSKGLSGQYDELKNKVFKILKDNNNLIYYVDKLSEKGNPKHGQVWAYGNLLKKYKT